MTKEYLDRLSPEDQLTLLLSRGSTFKDIAQDFINKNKVDALESYKTLLYDEALIKISKRMLEMKKLDKSKNSYEEVSVSLLQFFNAPVINNMRILKVVIFLLLIEDAKQ